MTQPSPTTSATAPSGRATPMPPAERRAAIIAATRGLLTATRGDVTTRQVAEAAGIAEGTIFRYFPTKADLMSAVVEDVLDPTELCAHLRTLQPRDLDDAVRQVFSVMQASTERVSSMFAALALVPDADKHKDGPPPVEVHRHRAQQVALAVEDVLAPFADQLQVPIAQAAPYVRSVSLATSHPLFTESTLTPDDAARLVLGGLARPTTQEA